MHDQPKAITAWMLCAHALSPVHQTSLQNTRHRSRKTQKRTLKGGETFRLKEINVWNKI